MEGVYKYEWDILDQLADENAFVIDLEIEIKLAADPTAFSGQT